jgi:hypothetical protein
VLREDPLETPRAGVDRALPDDEFKPIPFFQAVFDQAVENGVDMTVPSYYYAEIISSRAGSGRGVRQNQAKNAPLRRSEQPTDLPPRGLAVN